MFTPPSEMLPLLTSQRLAISLATVDLPLPEGPTSATNSPLRIVMEIPWSTSVSE